MGEHDKFDAAIAEFGFTLTKPNELGSPILDQIISQSEAIRAATHDPVLQQKLDRLVVAILAWQARMLPLALASAQEDLQEATDIKIKNIESLNESNAALFALYRKHGLPYGDTREGFKRWLVQIRKDWEERGKTGLTPPDIPGD